MDVVKIVVTGPESSGKSWLCEKLAAHFNAPWVPEYARQYLEKNGPDYSFETLSTIRKFHLEFQALYLKQKSEIIFLDTDLINFKVWEKIVFGKTHEKLEEQLRLEEDHRYLLTYPDIPWEPDVLRENPHDRLAIFEAHREEIEAYGRPYQIVKGEGEARLRNAINAIQNLAAIG